MASHCHCHHHQTPLPTTHCCCTTTPPPPPHDHHLLQAIASLLSHPHPIPSPKSHAPHNLPSHHRTRSTISSLLQRIESLESSLDHHTPHSLRHAAARVIQTHFRSFLVRRSRTLRHLKHLASIKSSFNSLKSSFSNRTRVDFAALSLKAVNLLLQLDSIQDCDPMVLDGKRSISRDLVQFLDSIEEVALNRHLGYVKAAKTSRSVQKAQKPRNSDDEEKRKLLQNLRGRVEKISRLCKVSENNEEDSDPDEAIHDDDGVTSVLFGRKLDGNRVFLRREEVQPTVKKSVRFAENANTCKVYSSSTCEPDMMGDMTSSDGSSSSDDQGEVLESVGCAVENVVDSSQGAEVDEEFLVVDNGGSGSSNTSDDGERNSRKDLENDLHTAKERLKALQEKLLLSAPVPLKMENRTDLNNNKVVRIS